VSALDERGEERAVRRREVARRSLEHERRRDERPQGKVTRESDDRYGGERPRANQIGGDHETLPVEAICCDAAVEAEDQRRDAVGESDRDDAERPTGLEREPHQRDVVERVAELTREHGEVDPAEVTSAE
jgi:hypothetical protein